MKKYKILLMISPITLVLSIIGIKLLRIPIQSRILSNFEIGAWIIVLELLLLAIVASLATFTYACFKKYEYKRYSGDDINQEIVQSFPD